MKNAKKSSLFSYISSTFDVWNLNIRFNMMWLSVLHRYGTGCIFTTRIERQHVARLIESDLVYISFYKLASSCIYTGWHVPALVNTRTVL